MDGQFCCIFGVFAGPFLYLLMVGKTKFNTSLKFSMLTILWIIGPRVLAVKKRVVNIKFKTNLAVHRVCIKIYLEKKNTKNHSNS